MAGGLESGVGGFGDFGVGDQFTDVGVENRSWVVHRGPGVGGDRRDRLVHGRVLGQDAGELRTGFDHSGDDIAVAVGGIPADQDVGGAGRFGGVDRFGDQRGSVFARSRAAAA